MSGTPHMTGRGSADDASESRSVSELLDDDGTVDHSTIREITNAGGHTVDSPGAEEVTEMRQRLVDGESYRDVAKAMGRGGETIRLYARGDREVSDGEPRCPPVEYRDGEWWVVDDD